jgi:hypothetical protein
MQLIRVQTKQGSSMGPNFTDQYHVVSLAVGTPPQWLNLTVDSNRWGAALFDKSFTDVQCKGFSDGQRRRFSSGASTTFSSASTNDFLGLPNYAMNWEASCALDENVIDPLIGVDATDDFHTGGFTATNVPFFLAKYMNASLSSQWHSDGVLGITSRVGDFSVGMGRENSTIAAIAEQVADPAVSFWFNRNFSSINSGVMTIGARDSKNCYDQWTYFNGVSNDVLASWDISVDSITFGNTQLYNMTIDHQPFQMMLSFDTTTAYITLDKAFLQRMIKPYKAIRKDPLNPSSDTAYVVNCADVKSLPDLVYTLTAADGSKFFYSVPSTSYAHNLTPRDDDYCTLLFGTTVTTAGSDDPPTYLVQFPMGVAGIQSQCWYLEYNTGRMGFATPSA